MLSTDGVNRIEMGTRTWADVAKLEIKTQKNEPRNLWVRCGYVSRAHCNVWEVHPKGKLRWWDSKQDIPGAVDIGGYLVTFRSYRARRWTLSLHRISLETFFPKPHPKLECDHRDEDRKNYAIRNLRWVTHSLNITFQTHKGWQRAWRPRLKQWRYRVRFRDHSYPWKFQSQAHARREYLYIRAVWIRNERERIIKMVMEHNGVERLEAIRMLNWDERDDVFFLLELNE